MSKFKVGDRVKITDHLSNTESLGAYCTNPGWAGRHGVITRQERDTYFGVEVDDDWYWFHKNSLKLIKGEQTMGRRTFRLLKESLDLKKGAIVQEKCDDGDQDYTVLDLKYQKFEDGNYTEIDFSRNTVENNPKWFEEVFPLVPEYGNKAELEAFKKFAKKRK